MRWLLLSSFALAGCGSVDVTPDPPHASQSPCVTSFGCDEGERCDEGVCVADVGCPGAVAPRVLYENANDTSRPYITRMNGHEYLIRQALPAAELGTSTTFVDLATGTPTVLHHAPGSASCWGDPLLCTVWTTAGTSTVLTGVTLDAATNVWSVASSQDLPASYPIMLGLPINGEAVLYGTGKPDLQTFNLSTGQSKPLLDLGGRSPLPVLTLPSGPILRARTNSLPSGSEFSFASIVPGAAWTTILTLPGPYKTLGLAFPAGDEWFVVADLMPSSIPHVWRVSPTSTHDVGESEDSLLPEVAQRYSSGGATLDGTLGKGLVCQDGTCHSGQLDLATLARTPFGSIAFPGVKRLGVQQERWLACDAVDALLYEPIFPADPKANAVGYRLHAVRVLPDAKP